MVARTSPAATVAPSLAGTVATRPAWAAFISFRSEPLAAGGASAAGGRLLNGAQGFAGRHGGPFPGRNGGDAAGLGSLHLVLHLHGFHHHQTLTGLHLVARRHEHADHKVEAGE